MSEDHEQRPLTDSDPSPESDPGGEANPEPNPDPDPTGDAGDPEDGELEAMAFEDAVDELETIVEELEDGDLGLEEAMERFERGLGLVEACRSKLEQAELKVEELLDAGETAEMDEPDE